MNREKTFKHRAGIVILAAGSSKRFGTNKLLAEYKSKPLFYHTFDMIHEIEDVTIVAVTGNEKIIEAGRKYGFYMVHNPDPEAGITHSLQLGIQKCLEMNHNLEGILFCVCDQPELQKETIEELLFLASKKPAMIICAGNKKRRGNPVYFDKRYFPELMNLMGDQGGKQIMKKYPDQVLVYEVSESQLSDVDTQSDLKRMVRICCD